MKSLKTRIVLTLFFLVAAASAFAQSVVRGTVSDLTGGLPGVTVKIKSSNLAQQTDNQGRFTIDASPGDILVFSIVGYNVKESKVEAGKSMSVLLEKTDNQLSEVVVTGFGVRQNTKKLSYSVTEVKGDDLVKANNVNIVNALQGKVAGVMINQGASGPASSSRIRIRGNSSLSQNTQPLLVIDNVLVEPGTTGGSVWGDVADFGNIMKNLNPDDYESVTVLKGSAASALYGSKAQNGVLLITTKKGRSENGIGVSFNHTESFETAYKTPIEYQNLYGGGIYPTFEKDANGVDIIPIIANINQGGYSFGPKFDGHMVKELDGRMVPWVANDPLDLYQTGVFRNTNVALDGKKDGATFRFSYSNLHNKSILPNNKIGRNNFALRTTYDISKRVSLDASVNYSLTETDNPGRTGSRNNLSYAFSYYMPRHVDLLYYQKNYINPVTGGQLSSSEADRYDPYRLSSVFFPLYEDNRTMKENNLLANVDLKVEIAPWLNALVRTNTSYYTSRFERKNLGNGVNFTGGNYQLTQENYSTYRVQGLLNANKQLTEDLYGTLSVGGETYRNVSGLYNDSQTNGGLLAPGVFNINNSVNPATTVARPTFGKRTDALYAYGDLTWKDQLTLNFSLRNDWSSTLLDKEGQGEYKYFYPGVGLAWTFTELPYFKDRQSVFSFGKLRGSYAQTGLELEPQMLNTVGYYKIDGTFNNANNGNQSVFTFGDNVLKGKGLKNQLTKEFEFGTDLKFFNGRLGLDAAWYKKNTYNQIVRIPMPSESGVTQLLTNAGNIQNSGIELLLTANPIRNDNFSWNSTFNFTRNRNKVIELSEGVSAYQLETAFGADVEAVAIPGGAYGTIRSGYAYATYQKKDANGNPIADPSNGQRVIGAPPNGTTGSYLSYLRTQDYEAGSTKVLGNIMESFLLNTIQEFRYKDFNLSFQVDAKVGGMMASTTHQYGSANGSIVNSLFGRDEASGGVSYVDNGGVTRNDGIIPTGVLADGVTVSSGGQTIDLGGMSYADAVKSGYLKPIPAYAYYENLTQWSSGIREESVFENSWVALREVSVGYNLPKRLSESVKMKNLRMTVTGRNLLYFWKNAKDGVNPESIFSNRSGSFLESGALPYSRMIGFTIGGSF